MSFMKTLFNENSNKLLSAMPEVISFDTQLVSLNDWWGKIALIGKINSHNVAANILEDMAHVQVEFGQLRNKLTENLLFENLQKLVLDNASRAQVAIDLLIRNLFERTADVGFLATDDDIRAFLSRPENNEQQIGFIENRLQEYVKKYSVYDEIIVLDTRGRVRAHLDKTNPVLQSTDPLIEQTLKSGGDFVETFRHSDLQANRHHSLIYSCKITQTNTKKSPVLGVLCLCFRFDDEMRGIFADLLSAEDNGIIAVLGADRRVIASSDRHLLPLGVRFTCDQPVRIARHEGHDYLINILGTNGYQGFFGLGWWGLMMAPLDKSFNTNKAALHDKYVELIDQSARFPKELQDIRKTSSEINADLALLVLNGKIASARKNATEFMPVLEAIKRIGSDIANIFHESVNSLQEVTISSYLNSANFLAALAADIMDRNLYERANDCRWWALTSVFRQQLANRELSGPARQQIGDILGYINGLYTVYTNLYVYDKDRRILAVSDPAQQSLVGEQVLESSGAAAALQNCEAQSYSVSAFEQTPLYQNRHTYIYNAAITALDDPRRILGGIGIVFDSEPQFEDMLNGILPRDQQGGILTGCFAVFAERNKTIISVANNSRLRVGDRLDLDNAFFALKNGARESYIVKYDDGNYVLGVAVSKGYREYKINDAYSNDVVALVLIPF